MSVIFDLMVNFCEISSMTMSDNKVYENETSQQFTWQQVAEQNHINSAWVIFCGKVYDVTKWLDTHPGGKEMLLLHSGRDITNSLTAYHPFTDLPKKMIAKYEIGSLVGDPEFPIYAEDTGFYAECRKRVGEYFQTKNIDPKDVRPGLWRMSLVFVVALLSYFVMNGPFLLPQMLIAACLFGICQALPLLHVMHDASHTAYTKNHRMWGVAGRLTMDWFAGASLWLLIKCLSAWLTSHVVGHHSFTNVAGVDPDLPANFTSDIRRVFQRQILRPIYAWQHIYLPILYGLFTITSRIDDFIDIHVRLFKGPMRVNPLTSKEWILSICSKMFWLTYRIFIPIYYLNLPLVSFWSTFLATELVTGWHITFCTQVTHVTTHCEYTCGEEDLQTSINDEWAVLQVKSSVDYSHGSWFTTFMSGALNYQITHHLFPSISQYHYPAIAPIVMDVCEKYKIKYNVMPSFWEALKAHIKYFKIMGISGKPVTVHLG